VVSRTRIALELLAVFAYVLLWVLASAYFTAAIA
jgi:hypothetical protein